jgi:exosome complex RNA-binding protein Rrp4
MSRRGVYSSESASWMSPGLWRMRLVQQARRLLPRFTVGAVVSASVAWHTVTLAPEVHCESSKLRSLYGGEFIKLLANATKLEFKASE